MIGRAKKGNTVDWQGVLLGEDAEPTVLITSVRAMTVSDMEYKSQDVGNIEGTDSGDMDIIHEDHESTMYDYEKEYNSLTIKDYRELSSYTTYDIITSRQW